ncbi:lycopene cyclase domain-containing protein [Flexivirga oryzae]|uniref:Lycopene cyclase domain-containing protein n=1 Tax=Flexivirga oryzae TaxID=1794944 RepID=A0A839NC48_9MICO|nr:lycopene cyclase domain-containing protein [Flexivirga oryzae]
MRHLAYAAALVACLAVTVPLVPAFGLQRVRRVRVLAVAICCAAAPFVVWDVCATRAGQWHFDVGQVLGVRLLGLPVEEWAFFVVIPFAAIACYEAVGALLGRRGR